MFSGQKLREIRHARGLSQTQVAGQMGVKDHYVSNWESGRNSPNGENMVKLLRALGCELEEVTE